MWRTPKTDWQTKYNELGEYTGDYLNVDDYTRIKENILFLKSQYAEYRKATPSIEPMETITFGKLCYAEEWNRIERNIEELLIKFGGLDKLIGDMKIYLNGGVIIDTEELNRIESLCLKIYEYLPVEYKEQSQLQFSLGLENIGIFSQRAEGVI